MYIGNDKIKTVENGLVTFENGTQEKFTDLMLQAIRTEEPLGEPILDKDGKPTGEYKPAASDLQELRLKQIRKDIANIVMSTDWSDDLKAAEVANKIIVELLKWGVYITELNAIMEPVARNFNTLMSFVMNTLNMHDSKARDKLFNSPELKRTINQINDVLINDIEVVYTAPKPKEVQKEVPVEGGSEEAK